MADQFFMTKKGYDEAVARLKYLQTEKRQEVVARIQEARSHGDLSENAEYDAAREEQRAVEGEISELDYKVKNAVIIEENADDSYDEECEYEITGSMESDPVAGKISNESPAGAALMRHKRGDVVEVNAPDGLYTLKILDIRVN